MDMLNSRTRWWMQGLALDLRSLSLFRILLALVMLVDLTNRLRNFEAHYTDAGVFPREVVNLTGEGDHWLSLYYLTGSPLGVGLLFGLSYLAAILLLVGKWTRVATAGAWILWLSLHTRNDFVVDGSDNMIRYFLLWGNFVPWASFFSLDSKGRNKPEGNQLLSIGSSVFVLQFVVIYFFTGLWKFGPAWHGQGNAIYMAASVDIFARGFADWIQTWPHWALIAMTKAIWILEVFCPFLVLVPWRNSLWRWVAIALFSGLQIGLALAFRLGHFPLISIALMAIFIPAKFWERWEGGKPVDWHWGAGRRWVRKSWSALCASLAGVAFLMNVVSFHESPLQLPLLKSFAETLRIDQKWSMFAPEPDSEDGWYVIPAQLADGSEWDMMPFGMRGMEPQPVSLAKPERVHKTFGTARWQAYMGALWLLKYSEYRPYLLAWIERKWQAIHPEKPPIVSINLVYMLEETGMWEEKEPEMVVLWRRQAGDPLQE